MEKLYPLVVIVFFSNLVEACAGFGATILAVIFGAQFLSIEELIPVLVPLNILLSAVIIFRYHRDIDRPALLRKILPLTGIGMPIGIAIFQKAPSQILKLAFGVIVVLLGMFELAQSALAKRRETPSRRKLSFWQGAIFLVGGGIMQGLYASGGPFVVYYASREIADKAKFRATLSLLWLILNLALAASLVFTGKLGSETLRASALLFPSVLLGMFVGMKVHERISEGTFRKFVYALLVIAGASLAYRASG
jgi:uncharacterized membrane protein YfcA